MNLQLSAEKREISGKKTKQLRNDKKLPAILYGHGVKNQMLTLDAPSFTKLYEEAGNNTIVDLKIGDGELNKILVAEVQSDPVKGDIIHADLHKIRMDEKITATVEIEFTGTAPAVKDLDGVLVENIQELEIKCLPADLIHKLTADVTHLKTFEDVITVKDLNLPENIEITHEQDDVVATVTPQVIEKEPEPVVEEGEEAEQAEGEGEKSTEESAGEKDAGEEKDQNNDSQAK